MSCEFYPLGEGSNREGVKCNIVVVLGQISRELELSISALQALLCEADIDERTREEDCFGFRSLSEGGSQSPYARRG